MVELIPREVLFGNPERQSPALSPDASQVAWLAPHEGVLNVWVAPFDPETGLHLDAARLLTDDHDRGIRTFRWAPDGARILYLQDAGGDENWRLFDVGLDSGERRDLTPFDGVQARIIASEPGLPNEILVGLNRENVELHDVYRLDMASGELKKEITNLGFLDWVADGNLVVRATFAPEADGGIALLVRASAEDEWRAIVRFEPEDALSTDALAFSGDGAAVLSVTSAGADSSRLVSIDAHSGDFEVLAERDGADVSQVRLHPVTKAPQVVTFMSDRQQYVALDDAVAEDLARVRGLHEGDMFFAGGDDADDHWLVGFTNDSGPVPYYVFRRGTGAARFLFEHQPALSRYELAPMEPLCFKARDGVEINGYASFPLGTGRTDLPTVLVVHGGPWARDMWGYNAEAQWLANRGYLCLQVNFRGSTGYGKAFINAGDREWGAKMHDDLVDAVAWTVAQGWADPGRVAIYGGSYGGYAALVGAAFTPEIFCCAVDVVGPSNLKTLIETVPPYWAPLLTQLHRRLGDPVVDEEFLWSRSPLSRVKDIRIPLLIAQGANDPRVKQAESEQIVDALVAAGIDHEYMLFPDEGHGFAKPENRLRFYASAERFLARHLGGRAEP